MSIKAIKKISLIVGLVTILSSCSELDKLDTVETDPGMIAVSYIQNSYVALSLQRVYVLSGKYEVFINTKKYSIPAGVCIDNGSYKLHKFDVKDFLRLYQVGQLKGLDEQAVKIIEGQK